MNAIAAERKLKGWSQEDLAIKMHRDRSTIARWEKNPESMGATSLCKLAELFGCSTDHILGRSEERSPYAKQTA